MDFLGTERGEPLQVKGVEEGGAVQAGVCHGRQGSHRCHNEGQRQRRGAAPEVVEEVQGEPAVPRDHVHLVDDEHHPPVILTGPPFSPG